MKARTKEQNAAHARAQREKKRLAAVPPGSVPPQKTVPPIAKAVPDVTPPAPGSGTCPKCERLATLSLDQAQEITRLLARIATLEAQAKAKADKPEPLPTGDNAEALRKRVIADKIDRINSYGRNPVIGSTRIL